MQVGRSRIASELHAQRLVPRARLVELARQLIDGHHFLGAAQDDFELLVNGGKHFKCLRAHGHKCPSDAMHPKDACREKPIILSSVDVNHRRSAEAAEIPLATNPHEFSRMVSCLYSASSLR